MLSEIGTILKDLAPVLRDVLITVVTGAVIWIGMAVRNAIRAYGKTELEMRLAEVERANQLLLAAQLTPDLDDDGRQELVSVEEDAVAVWRWQGWNFSLLWRSASGRYRDLVLVEENGRTLLSVATGD